MRDEGEPVRAMVTLQNGRLKARGLVRKIIDNVHGPPGGRVRHRGGPKVEQSQARSWQSLSGAPLCAAWSSSGCQHPRPGMHPAT